MYKYVTYIYINERNEGSLITWETDNRLFFLLQEYLSVQAAAELLAQAAAQSNSPRKAISEKLFVSSIFHTEVGSI